jgi:type I restriction-modification system DNA methylase subunit
MAVDSATVTLSQIAELAGVRPSAVSNWRKRFNDFPQPVDTAAGGSDLYPLAEVEGWLERHGRVVPDRVNERLLFQATTLLRGRMAIDDGIHAFASAIALSEAMPMSGTGEAPSVAARIELAERRHPNLRGAFEPLQKLDAKTADELMGVADWIDPDDRAETFEWILGRRSRFVETRTSEELTTLLVSLVGAAASVLDPTAGEGGVLAAVGDRHADARLFGQEINESAWRIAVQRFLLRGLNADMQRGDSLLEDRFINLRVDAVLCDPPYNMKNPLLAHDTSVAPWVSFAASRARTSDLVWLEHALGHLTDEGFAYVLLPIGSLFRSARERDVRVELIRRGAVDAVIALPAGSAQHTTVPLALWILRRASTPEQPILIVDATSGHPAGRRGLSDHMIERIDAIVDQWRAHGSVRAEDDAIAAVVPVVDVLATDAELTPGRWVSASTALTPDDRAREAEDAITEFVAARNRLTHAAPEIPLHGEAVTAQWVSVRELVAGDVAAIIRGTRVRPEDCLPDGVRVLRTRDIRDTITEDEPCHAIPAEMKPTPQLTQPGDVILSPASGRLRALVDESGEHILASPLQALRFRTEWLDPYVAAAFLESPRNRRFAKGTASGYARVDLRDLELPVLSVEEGRRLRQALEQVAATERDARALADQAHAVRESLLNSVGD